VLVFKFDYCLDVHGVFKIFIKNIKKLRPDEAPARNALNKPINIES
jgi:hypothetical protein